MSSTLDDLKKFGKALGETIITSFASIIVAGVILVFVYSPENWSDTLVVGALVGIVSGVVTQRNIKFQ